MRLGGSVDVCAATLMENAAAQVAAAHSSLIFMM
jgi:hypothetical protein